MNSKIIDIEYYYNEGVNALGKRKYRLAANMFKRCYEIYEESELPVYSEKIKKLGEDALEKYNLLTNRYLNENGFDEIEYVK